MTSWPSARAPRVLAALLRIGWSLKRQTGCDPHRLTGTFSRRLRPNLARESTYDGRVAERMRGCDARIAYVSQTD